LKLKALVAPSLGAAAAALTLGAGTAAAANWNVPSHIRVSTGHHVTVAIQKQHAGNKIVGGSFLNAAVTYLGVDRATIVAGLTSGQSLAQIATAHGKTADGLVAALLAPAKLKLDAAVAAGHLKADREATLLTKLQTALTTIVNKAITPHTPPNNKKPVRVNPTVVLQGATQYLGVNLKTIFQELRGGKTLADIAVAHGKTGDGLTAAVVASSKTQLDKQVASGRITAAQESDFLAQFQTAVAKIVSGA
jgi:hypothetical protein